MKRALVVLFALLIALAACGGGAASPTPASDSDGSSAPGAASPTAPATGSDADAGPIVVASKSFTEAFLIGEMYALLLENGGLSVERKLGLGSETIITEAMQRGEVDLYPEYTSTGLLAILQQEPLTDRQAIFDAVKSGYEERFDITWLDPAPFNNTQALAVTRETSEQYGLTTVRQLVELAPQLRIGGAPEFYERGDGLPGLEALYGEMAFASEEQVESSLRYEALRQGQFDVVVAYGTDGQIGGYDLVVLEDDKGLWPPYQVAPVVRMEVLAATPQIAEILNPLAPLLTDSVMANLNWMVDGPEKMEYEEVARDFLAENGLIPAP